MNKSIILILTIFALFSCKNNENPILQEEHFEAEGLYLINTKSDTLIYYFQGKLRTNDTIKTIINQYSESFTVKLLDAQKLTLEPPINEPDHSLGWSVSDTSIVNFSFANNKPYEIKHIGKKSGSATIELQLLHNGHPDFRTIAIPILSK